MLTLGLDPSLTNYGVALFDDTRKKDHCVWRGRIQSKPDEFVDFVDRYAYLGDELDRLIRELKPDRMGIEHPVHGSSQSEAMYALFILSLKVIKTHRKDVVLQSPSQLKTLARTLIKRPESWKMEKADMIEAAMKFVGDTGKKWHDGEADAFLVGLFSSRFWNLLDGVIDRGSLSPKEIHAFLDLEIFSKGKKAGQIKYKGIMHAPGDKYFLWSKVEGIRGKINKTENTKVDSRKGRSKKSSKSVPTSSNGDTPPQGI